MSATQTTLRRTPLYARHCEAGAKLLAFHGWELPLHYGSQIEEHHAVRRAAGMFDVSHMLAIDVTGPGARGLLRYAFAGDVDRTPAGRALYTCMLNPHGGIVDDVIAYTFADETYRVVVNGAVAERDFEWLQSLAADRAPAACLVPRRDLALVAVQGPMAATRLGDALPALRAAAGALAPFHAVFVRDWMVARTGYTGEDGFEIALPAPHADCLWRALCNAGVRPCGLGARDTLRLEAGMNLYGQDMDETTTPFECGIGFTVDRRDTRDFVGGAALAAMPPRGRRVGLVLLAPGVLRAGQVVHTPNGEGIVTSGTFAPTVGRSIALARVPAGTAPDIIVDVEIRQRRLPAQIVAPPFVRRGVNLVAHRLPPNQE